VQGLEIVRLLFAPKGREVFPVAVKPVHVVARVAVRDVEVTVGCDVHRGQRHDRFAFVGVLGDGSVRTLFRVGRNDVLEFVRDGRGGDLEDDFPVEGQLQDGLAAVARPVDEFTALVLVDDEAMKIIRRARDIAQELALRRKDLDAGVCIFVLT